MTKSHLKGKKKVEITQEEASSFAEQLKVDFSNSNFVNSDILWQYSIHNYEFEFPEFFKDTQIMFSAEEVLCHV